MATNTEGSVTCMISEIQRGNLEAFEKLWQRYFKAVIAVNRNKSGNGSTNFDEDDIASEVMFKLYEDLPANENISNRRQLWKYLLKVSRDKRIDEIRKRHAKKRGEGRVMGEAQVEFADSEGKVVGLSEMVVDNDLGPEIKALAHDHYCRMMSLLDEEEQKIAEYELQGLTIQEMANKFKVATRTIDRKLKNIRDTWAEFLAREED